jgi:hydroxyquinol 1,2-dioxygenase
LSDTLGVSMLVDAVNHRLPSGATETTVFGPFYAAPPEFDSGEDIRGHLQGRPMYVAGRVTDADGRPLAGAVVDVWHSDDRGFYDLQKVGDTPRYAGRGRFRTGADGRFHFWTIRPSAYPIPDDGPVGKMLRAQNRYPFRPEHIHFMVVAPSYRKLVTHIFAAGDQYLDSDVVFGVKKSLVEEYRAHHGGKAPDGRATNGDWFSLEREFRLALLGRDGEPLA